jgi:hypothetical protein
LETQILFSMGLESLSKTNELLASGQQLTEMVQDSRVSVFLTWTI